MRFGFYILAATLFFNPVFGSDISSSIEDYKAFKATRYISFPEKWTAWKAEIQNPLYYDFMLEESIWCAVDDYNLPLLELLLEKQFSSFKKDMAQDFSHVCAEIFLSSSSTQSQDLQDAHKVYQQRLLDENPVNQRVKGQTLLMKASEHTDANIVKFLLSQKADPNLLDNEGNSALMIASSTLWVMTIYKGGEISYSHEMMIARSLCEKGANVHQKNHNLDYPLKKAIQSNNFYIARVLYTFGAFLEEADLGLWYTNQKLKTWKQGYDDAVSGKCTQIPVTELAAYTLDPFGLHPLQYSPFLSLDRRDYFEGISWANPEYLVPYIEECRKKAIFTQQIKNLNVQEDV